MADGQGSRRRTVRVRRRGSPAVEARLRALIDQNADGMLVVLANGVIAFVNPAAQALLGRPDRQLVGELFGIPLSAGGTTEVDLPLPGEETRIAELRVVETTWEGQPAYIASLRDMTERRRMETELRRQAEELAAADRRKDEFLATLAHELRNPLAPMYNAVEIMRRVGIVQPAVEQQRELIARQLRHMKRLLDDLLDVSRISRGKLQLARERLDVAEAVHEAVETCRPLLEAQGQELSLSLPSLPVWVEADPTRLCQVLTNLLNNAIKYTDRGGRIALSVERQAGEVALRVQDNGVGMSPELLARVFDIFVQEDRSLARSQGGLGIGLTLVRHLVELHGGSVSASSPGPGQGSEFVVRIPAAAPPAVAALHGPAAVTPATAITDPESLRVLVVEDNQELAWTLVSLLELAGHQVRAACDGGEALRVAREHLPQVVLCDIGLPVLDGYQVARALRGDQILCQSLLVAVTGYTQEVDRRRSRQAGFDYHLAKPVDHDTLLSLLSTVGANPAFRGASRLARFAV